VRTTDEAMRREPQNGREGRRGYFFFGGRWCLRPYGGCSWSQIRKENANINAKDMIIPIARNHFSPGVSFAKLSPSKKRPAKREVARSPRKTITDKPCKILYFLSLCFVYMLLTLRIFFVNLLSVSTTSNTSIFLTKSQ